MPRWCISKRRNWSRTYQQPYDFHGWPRVIPSTHPQEFQHTYVPTLPQWDEQTSVCALPASCCVRRACSWPWRVDSWFWRWEAKSWCCAWSLAYCCCMALVTATTTSACSWISSCCSTAQHSMWHHSHIILHHNKWCQIIADDDGILFTSQYVMWHHMTARVKPIHSDQNWHSKMHLWISRKQMDGSHDKLLFFATKSD